MSVYCEAGRSTGLNVTHEYKSPQDRIKENIDLLKGNTRKAIKLLCKQYFILNVRIEQKNPVFINEWEQHRRFIGYLPERELIITYLDWQDHEQINIFEWIVKESEFNL